MVTILVDLQKEKRKFVDHSIVLIEISVLRMHLGIDLTA